MSVTMKVLLAFPPTWPPTVPHLALPCLAASLRRHGVEVVQRDLNLEAFDRILTSAYIEDALERIRQDYGPYGDERPPRPVLPEPEFVQWALEGGGDAAIQVEAAKSVIRSDAFFDGPVGHGAMEVIYKCLCVAALPFHPASLRLQCCNPPAPVDSSASLLAAARDPQVNMFVDIFREGALADIEREQPDVVGISAPSIHQFLPALTLAHLIKVEAGLPCHVTLGGPHVTMIRRALPDVPELFELFDSVVVFDGETALLRLAEALDGDGDLSKVPNLIYRENGQVRATERAAPVRMADLPTPDFGGLPLDRYLTPQLVLPLLSARGCYYGKCAFCNVGYGEPSCCSQAPAGQLAEQMLQLHAAYGAERIFFADEAITPHTLEALPPILANRGAPVAWGGCLRFEEAVTRDVCESMYAGGFRLNLIGLESASDAVLRRMRKDTDIALMRRVLRNSAEAGIWNHVFFFFGFPGETVPDAGKTVDFVLEQREFIHSIAFGPFSLALDSPAQRSPAAFGIERIVTDPEKDLAVYFDYEPGSGLDQEAAAQLCAELQERLPGKRCMQFYCNDAYRLLQAAQLTARGAPFPSWVDEG